MQKPPCLQSVLVYYQAVRRLVAPGVLWFASIWLASLLAVNPACAETPSGVSAFLQSGESSESEPSDILTPDQAFQLGLKSLPNNVIRASFTIQLGHYLYRERIQFSLNNPSQGQLEVKLPVGEAKHDPNFGDSQVFHHSFDADIVWHPPANAVGTSVPEKIVLNATYQGCSEKGLCYAPIKKILEVALVPQASTVADNSAAADAADSDDAGTRLLKQAHQWQIVLGFFTAGLLLSFTPCVLPMIPILSGIIVGASRQTPSAHSPPSRLHGFNLSLAYVLGMAASYTAAGIAAGLSGHLLSNSLQNPWVLSATALLFVILAFSMFGFYDLKLPDTLEEKLINTSNRLKGGHFLAVFGMGILSALIVSPCVAAPLAAALLYIGQTHQVFLGGLALFSLAIGMGVPLLLVGASAGAVLPKTGAWMNQVKSAFGFIMLGMALWMVRTLLPIPVLLGLWGGLLIIPAIYLHALDPLPAHAEAHVRFFKGMGFILLLLGSAMIVGALAGARSPFQPLAGFNAQAAGQQTAAAHVGAKNSEKGLQFEPIQSVEALEAKIRTLAANSDNANPDKKAQRYVMLDFYADWCVSCQELAETTFRDGRVIEALKQTQLLQADVTQNSAQDQQLLEKFGLFGPPAILFFDRQGKEIAAMRVIGYQNPQDFLARLEGLSTREALAAN